MNLKNKNLSIKGDGTMKKIILIGLCILLIGCNYECTDDCCYPNHCPYTPMNTCSAKFHFDCINPINNLSYKEELRLGLINDTPCC